MPDKFSSEKMTELLHPSKYHEIHRPIANEPKGKNLLSVSQLTKADVMNYIKEAEAARQLSIRLKNSQTPTLPLAGLVYKSIMRQPSTRTGGSMTTAAGKLGAFAELWSGMATSAAKGETTADEAVAFATQADLIGMRTEDCYGPAEAAIAIAESHKAGKLEHIAPIINLGDGTNEHVTQALGDMYTIYLRFGKLEGLKLCLIGDMQSYRAHHSLVLMAYLFDMEVYVVESPEAQLPTKYVELLGNKLHQVNNLDDVIDQVDILYAGRMPKEYFNDDHHNQLLQEAYAKWVIDSERLKKFSPNGIVMHPRPRGPELHPSIDNDVRAADVEQMSNMIPMRQAIIASAFGVRLSDLV